MSLGVVASVVGIGSAVYGMTQGGGSGASSGQQAANLSDPFNQSRGMYGQQLNQFMANPSETMQKSPGYQFQYQQGLDSLQRQFAAGGMSASGNALLGAEKYGQDYAQTKSGDYFNQLAQLSGASWNSGPNAANAMMDQQKQQGNAFAQGTQGIMSGAKDLYNNWGASGGNQPSPTTTNYGNEGAYNTTVGSQFSGGSGGWDLGGFAA